LKDLISSFLFYAEKLAKAVAKILPQPNGGGVGIKSFLRGALNPLVMVSVVSFVLAIALLVSQRVTDLSSIARIGAGLVAGSFGGIVTLATPGNPQQFELGVHSLTIAIIAMAVAYRTARRYSMAEAGDAFRPFHYSLGVTTFFAALGFLVQGNVTTNFAGSIVLSQPSIFALGLTFAFFWAVASLGSRRANFGVAAAPALWAVKSLKNFALIYGALILVAGFALWISALINPTFALSTEELPAAPELVAEQFMWAFLAILLYSGNLLAQVFFGASGVPIGIESYGFVSSDLLRMLEPANAASFWALPAFGPWAFAGIVALVCVVALVSGALAARRLNIKISGVVAFWQALVTSLAVTFAVAYFAGAQISTTTKTEGEQIDASIFWGVSFVGLLISSLVVVFVAMGGSGRLNHFTGSAFSLVFKFFRLANVGTRSLFGRTFGIAVSLLVLAAFLTPLTAASTNRIWGFLDGPGVLGQTAKEMLTKGDIVELKAYLQPKPGSKDVWFSDDILKAAQPSDEYDFSVSVMNKSDEAWAVGNLDAVVNVTLSKDGKSLVWPIETSSEMTYPSWLIAHPKFSLKLAPTKVDVTVSKLLPKATSASIKINGKKLSSGSYLAIPGVYKVEAPGYKLIAPTKKTVFTNMPNQKILIGGGIALPAGADVILDKGIVGKAKKCFAVSTGGSSDCVSAAKLEKAGAIVSGKEPENYFDSSLSNFKVTGIVCDAGARTEKLTSAIALLSASKCSAEVTYTKNFFKTAQKKVPRYIDSTTCKPAWLAYGFIPVSEGWGEDWLGDMEFGWVSENGFLYDEADVEYDSCYSVTPSKVQSGFETKNVRGALLTKVSMKAKVSSKVLVAGGLDAKGKFVLKK
jgi:hypothetical protein